MRYKPLLETETVFSDVETLKPRPQSAASHILAAFILIGTFLNLSVWLTGALTLPHMPSPSGPEVWTPVSNPHLLIHTPTYINGNITQQNSYRGPPSPSLTTAWTRIGLAAPGIRISATEARILNHSTSQLHLLPPRPSAEPEPEYLGMLEVFHLLHCLDSLRSTAYRELYRGEVEFEDIQHVQAHKIHLDHCVDMLRASLMCSSDLSVVMFKYDEHHKLPQPQFSMTKQCRDFEGVLEWSHANERRVEWDTLNFGAANS
jgi:hypothetical protein